jgi:hypothetical protein
LSDKALEANPARRLTRVAAHAVAGDVPAAVDELRAIDVDKSPIMISAIALPVDELPVFAALYDESPFREYATGERYRVASQARMLASGDTREEIIADVDATGYTLSH